MYTVAGREITEKKKKRAKKHKKSKKGREKASSKISCQPRNLHEQSVQLEDVHLVKGREGHRCQREASSVARSKGLGCRCSFWSVGFSRRDCHGESGLDGRSGNVRTGNEDVRVFTM